MNRRQFLSATASLAAVSALCASDADGVDAGGSPMSSPLRTGEPYELVGKRLVFTNWFYVRPGSFGWYDKNGNNVTVGGSAALGEAAMRRTNCPTGIRLVAQKAERRGPVLKSEKPWENSKGISFSTVMRDGGRYRAWAADCYYESRDGLTWERPDLRIVERDGSRANNLIDLNTTGGTVFRDPSAPQSERYKWVGTETISREEYDAFRQRRPDAWEPRADRTDVGQIFALGGAVSPDGLRWTKLPEPLAVEHSDTHVTAYYDERLRRYVIYTRNYMIGPTAESFHDDRFRVWWDQGRRSIGRTESADFREFPLSEVILVPTPDMEPSDLLYTNCRTTIPGAPDLHLMFPAIWHAAVADTTSIALASSHDGKVWQFVPGPSVLETAKLGEWDGGCVFTGPNLIELPNGDFALPYTGYVFPHKYPRGQLAFAGGYAIWPNGRLIALEARKKGEFATAVLMPPGSRMRINAVARAGGSIRIEVADFDGNAFPGRSFDDSAPVTGDQYRTTVAWKSGDDLGHGGKPFMLRFRMDRAQIFGLDFE